MTNMCEALGLISSNKIIEINKNKRSCIPGRQMPKECGLNISSRESLRHHGCLRWVLLYSSQGPVLLASASVLSIHFWTQVTPLCPSGWHTVAIQCLRRSTGTNGLHTEQCRCRTPPCIQGNSAGFLPADAC